MVFKHSALFAVVAASALAGFGADAFAGDKASAGETWAAPNVPGMPGYKEPPKAEKEASLPIPVPTVDGSSASYHQRRAAEQGSGK
ncbi:MAG: hypothetical protein N2444_04275 [Methylocystis sp.]|nr:hypothetical protein [Methylocystis sp.]